MRLPELPSPPESFAHPYLDRFLNTTMRSLSFLFPKMEPQDTRQQTRKDICISSLGAERILCDSSDLEKPMTLQRVRDYQGRILDLNPNHAPSEVFTKKDWDIRYYNQVNMPIVLGALKDPDAFQAGNPEKPIRILDLPIYMPEQGWKIPSYLEQFKEVIKMSVDFERVNNPGFEKDHYVYITVDQGLVPPFTQHRRGGWHGDSYRHIDSRTTNVRYPTDNLYVIANACPTIFVPGPFDFEGVDPSNLIEALAHLTERAEQQSSTCYPNCTLLRMDPYCVHDAGINRSDKTVFRTFVKVSISKTKYCKLGNAKNPLFQYEWNMIPRHGVPYSKPILAQSSLRRDRDAFKDVDPTEIDFMGSDCNVAWAESRIHNCYRSQPVRAAPAEEGEMLGSCHDDFLITVNVAQAGDWKITPKYGDEYFLPAQKLQANYERSEDDEELFLPKKTLRRCVKLSEDITFKAPWGTRSFAKAGDYLVYLNDADIYPIPKDVFEHEHTLCR